MEKILAYDKFHQDIKEVAIINFTEKTCFLWSSNHGNVRITIARNFEDVEFLRPTGFHDKNKNPIYQGEIIELINEDGEKVRAVCEFGSAQRDIYGNTVEIIGFYFRLLSDGCKTFPIINNYLGKHDTEIFEIIGNIYQDKNLLGGN